MKIAIFTDTYTPEINGVAKTLAKYTEYLKENEIDFRVFAPKSTSDAHAYNNRVFSFMSLPFILYPECRIALPHFKDIKDELTNFNPDIIHIATPFNMGLCGLHYAKKFNIPVVASYHTDFENFLDYYELGIFKDAFLKYINWFHRPMKKIFVPSKTTKLKLAKQGLNNLEIWSRGVDCQTFHPRFDSPIIREHFNIKEKYILLYVGRISPEKNTQLLLKIAESLPNELRNDIHWLIVGDGPEKNKLEKKALKNMTFTGVIEGDLLTRIYATADLFVFPSHTETFGNVVLESLASGTPVVTVNSGGVKDIVNNGLTGYLCTPNDPVDFSNAITTLLKQDRTRYIMGENGRRYALSYDWDEIFKNLLKDYKIVLNNEKSLLYTAN